jgi:endonuclease/exonuclease/phosphatase (EEP) superfamily protein YafD/protein-S-isoprenylcysteine O-methyltransferase Ste14
LLLALTDLYAIALLIYFVLRLLWGDQLGAVALVSVFLPWFLLPPIAFFLTTLLWRRWPAAVLQGALVAAFLGLYGGLLLPQAPPDGMDSLTVMTYNVAANSYWVRPGELAPLVRASGADIVALTEVAPQQAQEIEQLLDLYPYQVIHALGIPGKALLSRYPLQGAELFYLQSHRLPHLRATVLLTDTTGISFPLTVIVAHPPPPIYGRSIFTIHPDAAAEISALAEMTAGGQPALLLGDFNLVDQSDNYRLLTQAGLTDAFRAAGWGLGATYPANRYALPFALIRIDYVWYTPPFSAARAWVGPDASSDHLPVLAELVWATGPAPPAERSTDMIPWMNFAVLLVAVALMLYLYILSVRPAALEKRIGPAAYKRCGRYRFAAMALMFLIMGNYIVYYFYPLPLPLPHTFPWAWWVSGLIAALLAIPSGYLVVRGMRDAGAEAAAPRPEQKLFGGIYNHIRHPQAWEAVWWFVLALALHSPFLTLFSLLLLPVEYTMVMAEERDLVLRFGQQYEDYRQRTGAFWPRRRK